MQYEAGSSLKMLTIPKGLNFQDKTKEKKQKETDEKREKKSNRHSRQKTLYVWLRPRKEATQYIAAVPDVLLLPLFVHSCIDLSRAIPQKGRRRKTKYNSMQNVTKRYELAETGLCVFPFRLFSHTHSHAHHLISFHFLSSYSYFPKLLGREWHGSLCCGGM